MAAVFWSSAAGGVRQGAAAFLLGRVPLCRHFRAFTALSATPRRSCHQLCAVPAAKHSARSRSPRRGGRMLKQKTFVKKTKKGNVTKVRQV